jgi:VanZ family protein
VIAFAALILPGTLHYLKNMIWLTPAALVFGATIERVQILVGRSAEMADFVADGVGVACGLILGLTLRRRWFQPRRGQRPGAAAIKAPR